MRIFGIALLFVALMWLPGQAAAKGKKDPCAKADLKLLRTGEGDRDHDGLSDCRESRFRSDLDDPDTDRDGLDDGDEFHDACNVHDPDSDGDGIPDGEDPTPAIRQKMEALLDAITCPLPGTPETPETPGTPGTPGSITALGSTIVLDDATRFDDTTCAALAAALVAGETPFVEIKILEDMLGTLRATKVEREDDHGEHHGDDDDDQGEDDD